MTLCMITQYGWEFSDRDEATAIPPVDAGQASWFVTSLFSESDVGLFEGGIERLEE
jgi:hypothetical protein